MGNVAKFISKTILLKLWIKPDYTYTPDKYPTTVYTVEPDSLHNVIVYNYKKGNGWDKPERYKRDCYSIE
jgi:hypothetical protein